MGKARKNTEVAAQKQLLGRPIMCIGLGGALYQCQNPKCGSVKKKGMFVEYKSTLYCTERCIKEANNLS